MTSWSHPWRSRDLQREKVRIYALAKELNVESKDLLDLCRQAGFDVQNQLSVLDPEQRDAVEVMIRKGGARGEGEPVKPAPVPTPPVVSIPRDGGETKVVLKPHAHYSPARNPGIERLLDVGEKA